MNSIKFSIIVPVYNTEKYLPRCIKSILNQSYNNFELILIDDGSNDSSGEICDRYKALDNRISVIHQASSGVSNARNVGLELASGSVICFCDADDVYDDDALRIVAQTFQKNPSCKIVISGFNRVRNGFIRQKKLCKNQIWSFKKLTNHVLYDEGISGSVCNKFFKQEILVGEFFDENISMCEDMHFVMKALTKLNFEKSIVITDCLYNYFDNSQSATHSVDRLFNHNNELLYIVAMDKIQNYCKLSKYTRLLLKRQKYVLAAQCYINFTLDNKKSECLKKIMRANILYYIMFIMISPMKNLKFLFKVFLYSIRSK